MRSKSIDHTLLVAGIILMLVSSYQLFFWKDSVSDARVLGKLSSLQSVVKVKSATTLDWRDAYMGNEVAENQLIYTDQRSGAEVVFNEGNQLLIGENTLIKISSHANQPSLDVERGIIRARLEGKESLRLEMNGKEIALSGNGAEVQISLNDQQGEIGVLKGDVTVEGAGATGKLDSQTALAIQGESFSVKKISYTSTSPVRDSAFYTDQSASEVEFAWEPEGEATVIVSNSPHLKKSREYQGSSPLRIALAPGLYYWKVKGAEGESLVSSFRIHQEIPPVVLRPRSGETVSLPMVEGEEPKLLVQWQQESSLRYRVEWENGSSNTEVLTGGSAALSVGAADTFRWRVKIEDPNRTLARWTEWQEIKVQRLAPPIVPTELAPHEVEYQTYKELREQVELSWTSSSLVDVEVQRPDGSIRLISGLRSPYTYEALGAGLYQWRVRASDEYKRQSEWSEWQKFTLVDLRGETSAGIQLIQLKKPDQQVHFNWDGDKSSVSLFELSENKEFSTVILKREIKGTETKVVVPKIGSYFWRSRQYLPDGRVHTSEPVKVIIEPTPMPGKPKKLPDMKVPLEWKVIEQKSSWNIMDLFFARAWAEEVKGVVKLELPYEEEAKAFHVRIFSDAELKELVFEQVIDSKKLDWEGARPGVYYWQYAVIDFWDRKTPFSEAATLTITGTPLEAPEKPRLLEPIRAMEVEPKDIVFRWTSAGKDISYQLEISDSDNFSKILFQSTTPELQLTLPGLSAEGLHFWRLRARNKLRQETLSNTGRFTVRPPLERSIIADQHGIPQKRQWLPRLSIAWSPSQDEYTFTDNGQTGTIDGRSLMGIEAKGSYFKEKWAFHGELLRQSGKVFESQEYLFQRLLADVTLSQSTSSFRWGYGLALGQTSAQTYSISSEAVTANAVSSLNYGPVVRAYLPLNETWEVQGRATYLLGEITQLEAGADLYRSWRSYLLLFGAAFSNREYQDNSGKQSSLRISLGVGKDF